MAVSRERAQALCARCRQSGDDLIRLGRHEDALGDDRLYALALWQEQNIFELATRFSQDPEHRDLLMAAMEQALSIAERTIARLKERAGIA